MTDHLPECDKYALVPRAGWVCICDALRACEQRVLDAIDLPAANVQYQRVGYAAGVQAARDAVRVLMPDDYRMNWCAAIDAIDALKVDTPEREVIEHINLKPCLTCGATDHRTLDCPDDYLQGTEF